MGFNYLFRHCLRLAEGNGEALKRAAMDLSDCEWGLQRVVDYVPFQCNLNKVCLFCYYLAEL